MDLFWNILTLIHRNLFYKWKNEFNLALIYVVMFPLKKLAFEFAVWAGKRRREVYLNSQVMLLERALNIRYLDQDKWATDASPTAVNGIYIDSSSVITNQGFAWNLNENQPNDGYAYNVGETPITPPPHTPEYAYNLNEFLGQDVFVVKVPAWFTYDETEMRAFIDRFRMAGRNYSIETY